MSDTLVDYLSQFVSQHKLRSFDRVLDIRTRHFTVVLENIYDRHNISACLRSCDCFGIQDVHVVEVVNEYCICEEVTCGADQWLSLTRYRDRGDNFQVCLDRLRSDGYRIVATTPQSDATPLEQFDMRPKSALWFGNEHDGLSDRVLQEADECLRIPSYGFTESFNISVAVAIVLHHLTEKLRQSDDEWRLRPEERRRLKAEWIRNVVRKKFHRDEDFWQQQLRECV